MALTIIRKGTAMTERVIAISFGLAHRLPARPSDNSVDLQRIGCGSEK